MFNHINFIFICDILILAIVFIGGFFIGRFIGNLVYQCPAGSAIIYRQNLRYAGALFLPPCLALYSTPSTLFYKPVRIFAVRIPVTPQDLSLPPLHIWIYGFQLYFLNLNYLKRILSWTYDFFDIIFFIIAYFLIYEIFV